MSILLLVGLPSFQSIRMTLSPSELPSPSPTDTLPYDGMRRNGPRFIAPREDKYSPGELWIAQYCLLFITLQLSATPLILSMNTHRKNKTAHPGVPDMTPSQLLSARLSRTPKMTPNTRRPSSKKLTKDQQIAALKDELRAAQELMSSVSVSSLASVPTRCDVLMVMSVSRPVLVSTIRTMTRLRHRWMRVAILIPQPTPKRAMPLWVRNARWEDWQVRQQGASRLISLPSFHPTPLTHYQAEAVTRGGSL